MDFCTAIWSDFKIKKIKRRFGNTSAPSVADKDSDRGDKNEQEEEVEEDIARKSIG
jgi:hypothetical protein